MGVVYERLIAIRGYVHAGEVVLVVLVVVVQVVILRGNFIQ